MILLADSGSTKTDWRLIEPDGSIIQYKSQGINPYLQTQEEIRQSIQNGIQQQVPDMIRNLFFYGAGCASDVNRNILVDIFQEVFPGAKIFVHHDLTGAARSLCGHEEGIACILGTGANSCYYDGKDIVANVPSLGYVLGDEGSGAWLGKQLLAAFIRGELEEEMSERFSKRFELDRNAILDQVYKKPMPNRFLASFSKFIFQNINDPFLYQMVYDGFEQFFIRNVEKYKNYKELPVHFTGSVAFYYSNILRQVANDRGIILKNIVETPIAGLTLYHQKIQR